MEAQGDLEAEEVEPAEVLMVHLQAVATEEMEDLEAVEETRNAATTAMREGSVPMPVEQGEQGLEGAEAVAPDLVEPFFIEMEERSL
jgi:hypothetical protein